jgi:hypothetical protein
MTSTQEQTDRDDADRYVEDVEQKKYRYRYTIDAAAFDGFLAGRTSCPCRKGCPNEQWECAKEIRTLQRENADILSDLKLAHKDLETAGELLKRAYESLGDYKPAPQSNAGKVLRDIFAYLEKTK